MWLPLHLALHNLKRGRNRALLVVFTLVCALASYSLLGAVIGEMRYQAGQMLRPYRPYDILVQTTEAEAELARIRQVPGVARVESATYFDVLASWGQSPLMILDPGNPLFTYDLESGRLPERRAKCWSRADLLTPLSSMWATWLT